MRRDTVKPGDLAVIVRSSGPENVGRIVKVLDVFHSPGAVTYEKHEFVGFTGLVAEVETEGAPLLARCVDSGRIVRLQRGLCKVSNLRPLRDKPGDAAMGISSAHARGGDVMPRSGEKPEPTDTDRLDFIQANPSRSLRQRKGRWAFPRACTSYEYTTYRTVREAIDAAMQETDPSE